MARSMRWRPLAAYTFFGTLLAGAMTLLVVGVFMVRNPATGVWAVFVAPLYFLAFAVVAEAIVVVLPLG